MRWEALFDDLEAQLRLQEAEEFRAEVAERSRAEQSVVLLADRLRAHQGRQLVVRLRNRDQLQGQCRDVAVEWMVLQAGTAQCLVPLSAVTAVSGLSRSVAPSPGAVLRRLGLPHALRALARNRAAVRLRLDGGEVTGTIDRVGADHLDLAEHAVGEPRRQDAVRQVLAISLAAVVTVVSTDAG